MDSIIFMFLNVVAIAQRDHFVVLQVTGIIPQIIRRIAREMALPHDSGMVSVFYKDLRHHTT